MSADVPKLVVDNKTDAEIAKEIRQKGAEAATHLTAMMNEAKELGFVLDFSFQRGPGGYAFCAGIMVSKQF